MPEYRGFALGPHWALAKTLPCMGSRCRLPLRHSSIKLYSTTSISVKILVSLLAIAATYMQAIQVLDLVGHLLSYNLCEIQTLNQ
jgi:hypothetical protein